MGETETRTDDDVEGATDPLLELLTPSARAKILLALIQVRGEKLNPTHICDSAGITRDTWYAHRDVLVEDLGVIKEADPAGNSPMYRVDMDDPVIQLLAEIRSVLADRRLEQTSGSA